VFNETTASESEFPHRIDLSRVKDFAYSSVPEISVTFASLSLSLSLSFLRELLFKMATEAVPDEYRESFKLLIPEPTLSKSFRLVCDLEAVRSLGSGLTGDDGQ
jgi:hypothetical protein